TPGEREAARSLRGALPAYRSGAPRPTRPAGGLADGTLLPLYEARRPPDARRDTTRVLATAARRGSTTPSDWKWWSGHCARYIDSYLLDPNYDCGWQCGGLPPKTRVFPRVI